MSKRKEAYLGTTEMRATACSLSLASSVLGFEIVELWSDQGDGKLHCTYVHCDEHIIKKHPDIIVGHFPNHKREHKLSPKLCQLARKSPNRYHWRILDEEKEHSDGSLGANSIDSALSEEIHTIYSAYHLPFKTEMAYLVEGGTGGTNVFIVALSMDRKEFKEQKLKFLQGVAYAIYVAAFDLDEESDEGESIKGESKHELDVKEHQPTKSLTATEIKHASTLNLLALTNSTASTSADRLASDNCMTPIAIPAEREVGVWTRNRSESNLRALGVETPRPYKHILPPVEEGDPVAALIQTYRPNLDANSGSDKMNGTSYQTPKAPSRSSMTESLDANDVAIELDPGTTVVQDRIRESASNGSLESGGRVSTSEKQQQFEEQLKTVAIEETYLLAPTWEPTDEFCFPVAKIPILNVIPCDLTLDDFSRVVHIADGSNSNVFTGVFRGEEVIIKMIKQTAQGDETAVREFDLEHGVLARLKHKNIIKILGAGFEPRRFIVLEMLTGGSLNTIMRENIDKDNKGGLAYRLFKKPTFTYANLLQKAKEMAEGFLYLHGQVHPDAVVIHRDLKPDNIGFTSDGTLKLFDFGLVTCVKARESADQAYDMTGCTGSLRYMAPEVALRQPYTEKVDVYSFGILLWQMARDRAPFKGLDKDQFMSKVVGMNERPKLDKTWPAGFSQLLTSCWDRDPKKRPTFSTICYELTRLINEDNQGGWGSSHKPWGGRMSKQNGHNTTGANGNNSSPVIHRTSSGDKRHSNWF